MSFFSFLSKQNNTASKEENFNNVFTKELFVNIINSSHMIMIFFSKTDGWIGANEKFFKIFGYKDIENFRNQHESIRELFLSEAEEIFTEDDNSWLNYIKKYNKNGYKIKLHNANKELLEINLRCKAIDNSSEIYMLELEDVSEIYNAAIKTKSIEKLKTKILSNIDHYLHTSMNQITKSLDLIFKTQINKAQKEYLNLIDNSSKNLISNIENLLNFSQIQNKQLSINNSNFELIASMEKLIYNHIITGKNSNVKILSFIDPKLPQELYSDIKKIKQIMNLFIKNAIKSSEKGGIVNIEIKLLKRESNGDCSIGFSVKNNGKAIDKDNISLITKSFKSGDYTDDKLDIELSLAYGLIKLLGSELNIQSKDSNGSCFNFVLNFLGSNGQRYKMKPKKKVKVLLIDKTKINEANLLSIYLRSFTLDVVKSDLLDKKVYDGVKVLYIVANQNDLDFILKFATIDKRTPVILLVNEGEELQEKLTGIIDEVISSPLLPSVISEHLELVEAKKD